MATSDKLFNPPPTFKLPLTRGNDLSVRFVYRPLVVDGEGSPVLDGQGNKQFEAADYPDGSTVTLVLDTDPVTTFTATISGSVATVFGDYTALDGIKSGTLWRAVLNHSNGFNQVMCNGTVVRSDGK